ncbi:transcription factor bHLH162-like [Coffea arabica]|uniref:Transcription factor bHLH162-like n=1 Tax=Coffea arabica TaxID=13443 RepID=A0ABM4UAD0_COFAR
MERFHPSPSNPKMERRIVEKNRRSHMKDLYARLYGLVPSDSSKENLTVPDQIDEAINYIKSMEKKLEKCKEKKEKLLFGKRPYSGATSETTKITNVEVHDMGPNMDVILLNGLEEQASFYGIIRLLCKEGFEVVNANFSSNGNSVLHVVHDKGGISTSRTETTAVVKRLKELIYGYSHGEVESRLDSWVESRLDSWDFEIEPDILNSNVLELMSPGQFCFLQQL